MKEAVTLLMDKANSISLLAKQAFAAGVNKLEEARDGALAKADELVRAAQEICEHDGPRRTEDDHDCHNNVHWENEYCVACGKYLGRH